MKNRLKESAFVNMTVGGRMRMEIAPERMCRERAAETLKVPTFSVAV